MVSKIIWSRPARKDLREIAEYIRQDSPQAAEGVVRTILGATRNLAVFPQMGREVPELPGRDIRELIQYSYRILYRVAGRRVYIVAVIHGARMLTKALRGRRL
jgi:addiction module RelE/StbE family toxin